MKIKIDGGGIGLTLLTIAFVLLKVFGYIDWAWYWVLAPLWAPIALWLLLIAGFGAVAFVVAWLGR